MEDRKTSTAEMAEQTFRVGSQANDCGMSISLSVNRCQRWHPLVCVNQSLLMELKWIRDHHRLASDERRSATYAKAMASIKAYPYAIKTAKEALNILGVGDKIAAQCGEYAKTGKIHAAGMSNTIAFKSKLILQRHRGDQTRQTACNDDGLFQDPWCGRYHCQRAV